ncbi:hypothetical protein AA983_05120 [Dermacoccus sp. PE3]|nr:hypothetical protein AA983_05120 [Dermacoccus sp. PE3]
MPDRRSLRPRLYLVTDTHLCGGPRGVVETALAAAKHGADIVQLRDHDATTRELAALAAELVEALEPTGVPLVIDDRLDVALAAGAAGVHLGQSDLDPVAARRIAEALGRHDFHIGWSVSRADEIRAADAMPPGTLDLLGIGPYRATPTKPNAPEPLGADGVGALVSVARAGGVPAVVIGGVKQADVGGLVREGVRGVAVVSAICGQPDPASATRDLRAALDEALARDAGERA